jgi:hypothetical protein
MKTGLKPCAPYLLFTALLLSPLCSAADSSDTGKLLENFRQMAATGYAYQETRILDLVDAPAHSTGYLYSSAAGTLIKLQLSPERIIMAITATRMYYYNAAQGQRYSAPLDFAAPMAAQIGGFRAILQGRAAELSANYDIDIKQRGHLWTLHLNGKAPDNAGLVIEVSGDETKPQRKIMIQQPDGEKTEYMMKPETVKQPSETTVERLLTEATGE